MLYVSPLKALNYDIERNLRGPLAGLESALRVGVRTGDTPAKERRELVKEPPDILITTPESLYLLLTSAARETLRGVETLILDEVHAVAGTKRGAHLALSVERLQRLVARPPSSGSACRRRSGRSRRSARFVSGGRPIELVDAGTRKELDLQVVVPVEDLRELGSTAALSHPLLTDGEVTDGSSEQARSSIWPSMYPELLALVEAHRSTIVFVNNRRLAERLALRLNELAEREIARAHHGSLAREQRVLVEEDLKAGRIPCLVATSSLELGIDMGAVDLVIQVESPKSVARGLQRIGRAGHELDAVSKGRIFPKFRADLLESAVVARAMRAGEIEETKIPRNPLDVLAQQIVAISADEEIEVAELHDLVRRAYPFADLSRAAARERARHARRPLPVRRVRRAAAADRLGPHRRHDPRPRGRAPARGHERRHDPRPRPLRRLPGRRRRPRRRARRGDGLRGARRARRSCSAPRPGGSRRSRATACSSRRPRGCRARCRSGRARASGGRTSSAQKIGAASRELVGARRRRGARAAARRLHARRARRPRTCSRSCATRPTRPAPCRPTARSSSSASATRSATGASAS